jgi:glycosyltransferase involved in cell wall biosynthesis
MIRRTGRTDWQLMVRSAGPELDTPRGVSAGDRVDSRDESGVEAGANRSSSAHAVRVLLVADVRSPTAWGWVDAVRSADVVVLGVDGLPWPEHRSLSASGEESRKCVKQRLRPFAGATPRRLKMIARVRRVLGLSLTPIKGRRLHRVVKRAKPDVIHGLRIPYEAMAALAACPPAVPLAVSIWGNDLTHEASKNRLTGRATRKVLARTDLLFADCQRDIDLAGTWGLRPATPTAVLPGGGGIDLARIAKEDTNLASQLNDLPRSDYRLVVNARGGRPYVRNDVLLEALSLLATDLDPRVRVVFIDSAHDGALQRSIECHRLRNRIIVMGKRSPCEVFSFFRRAEVSVSITDQDGTPNSLLEAMAAGAIPVCGDLPSIREWVEPGRNGFLAAFNDPQAVADALRLALSLSDAERRAIRTTNSRIIAARAERSSTGRQAAEKYRKLAMHREERASAARNVLIQRR